MHVGCHLATGDENSKESNELFDATANSARNCCCDRHACPQPGTESPGERPGEGHDSDNCVVCQAFYTSRDGIVLPLVADVPVQDSGEYVCLAFAVTRVSRPPQGFQSRGPPAIS